MGYNTTFYGSFAIDIPLNREQIKYLQAFNQSRRMKRDTCKLKELYNGAHGLNGDYGIEGEYFAFPGDNFGQARDASIIDYNVPPGQPLQYDHVLVQSLISEGICQPSLWCGWTVSSDGTILMHDGREKFYEYYAWLRYLIDRFFVPWGYVINGHVIFQGEERKDRGDIVVVDNCTSLYRHPNRYKDVLNQ